MRFGLVALSLAGLAAAAAPPVPDSRHNPTPPAKDITVNFIHLMSASIIHQDADYIFPGPLGLRINRGYVGGNLTNPDGSLLATVIPIGSNNGIIDATRAVHIDARMTLQFAKDQHYMFLRAAGVFPNLDLKIETDSPTYKWMNDAYIFSNFTLVGSLLTIDAFTTPTQSVPHP